MAGRFLLSGLRVFLFFYFLTQEYFS